MPRGRTKEPSEARLTVRQREWLGHLRAAERAGETIKAYAAQQGLSVQSLYQAGKRLRRRGVIEPRVRRGRPLSATGFVRVEPKPVRREIGAAWRIRLPSGVIFECSAPLRQDDLLSLLTTLGCPR
jgi:hypothetical protein